MYENLPEDNSGGIQRRDSSTTTPFNSTIYTYLIVFSLYCLAKALPGAFLVQMRVQYFTKCDLDDDGCDGKYALEGFYSSIADSISLAFSCGLTLFLQTKSDKYGRKFFLIITILLASFPYLCFYFTNIVWYYYAANIIGGLGGSMFGFLELIVSDCVPRESRGTFFGFVFAFSGFGGAIGAFTGPILKKALSSKAVFGISFLISLLCIFFISLLPETRSETITENAHVSFLDSLQKVWQSRLLLCAGFILFTNVVTEMAVADLSMNYFAEALDLSGDREDQFNATYLVIASLAVPITMGFIYPFLIKRFSLINLLTFACALSGPHMFLYAFLPLLHKTYPILIASGTTGFTAMSDPTIYAIVSNYFPADEQSVALGFLASMDQLTQCIGPVGFGGIYKATHKIFAGMWLIIGGTLCFASLLVIPYIRVTLQDKAIMDVPQKGNSVSY